MYRFLTRHAKFSTTNMARKANVLLVGSGGVGTMGAYALEAGGKAEVTAVLRSNFNTVNEKGFDISSINHGEIKGWKPSRILNKVPVADAASPFDFVVVSTKNVPDVPPTVAEIIKPAVTEGKTAIVLVQNGLNIEVPVIQAFPQNIVISGISRISAAETSHGTILHNDHDRLQIGPFENTNLPADAQVAAAERFAEIYGASGNVIVEFQKTPKDVAWARWRKLIYNACYNTVSAVTLLDTGRLRIAESPVSDLLVPAMTEIVTIAKALGHDMPLHLVDEVIACDPIEIYFKPSMQQDVEKGNFTEFENILGEPLRTAEKIGVPAPTLKVLYGILRAMQWRTKEKKGLVSV